MNKLKKKIFQHYEISLTIIIAIIIALSFVAEYYDVKWEYIIPVAIALASITYPLLNDAKRRNDREQEAFDSFYFSVYSLPRIVTKAIYYIDENLNSKQDEPIILAIDSKLNANFINYINHADLNRFFRDQGMLNELREVSSSLLDIDRVNDYYNTRASEHNIIIREQKKVWWRWQTLIGKIWYEIACAKSTMQDASKESMVFFEDYRKWVEKVNIMHPLVEKSVADSLIELWELTQKLREGYSNEPSLNGSDEYIVLKANEINEQANLCVQAYDAMIDEKTSMLNTLSTQKEILEVAKKRFENFININEPLISKGLKKQLDEMEQTQAHQTA